MLFFSYNMSSKIILLLTVFMIFGMNNMIQAGVIPGLDVPALDITSIVGKWDLIASTNADDQNVCTSSTVEQYSKHNFTMYMSRVLKPDLESNTNLSDQVYNITVKSAICSNSTYLFHVLKNNSDIFAGSHDISKLIFLTFFGPEYKVYLFFYVEGKAAQAINGSNQIIFIFGRENTLPDEFPEAVEGYGFYRYIVNTQEKLLGINSTVCE